MDDVRLGRILKQLAAGRAAGPQHLQVALIEKLLRETGDQWDRRAHRTSVVAGISAQLADHWQEQRPWDPDARLLSAMSYWERLRRASVEGAQTGVPVDPKAALQQCLLAADLQPLDPTPWVVALGVSRVLRHPRNVVAHAWNQVQQRDPWNREANIQLLQYLSPEENGSLAQTRSFLDERCAVMPPDTPCAGLRLAAAVQQYHRYLAQGGTVATLEAARYWSRPDVAAHLDQALGNLLRPEFLRHAAAVADLNNLAYALTRAGRSVEARPVFRAIRGLVTARPWSEDGDPVERFSQWHTRLLC
ncbi:hypothetical protein [Streptomyces chartreusis]|uniref:hypothetical protein n=1 Tax=Streptomyces chartreusis TaxID=1969 RepID=UPI002101B630|nr:hypothetical protein [Streptomyces chartreusis]